jgi:5-methyltetrahydrofolate--homocysteine methyltransferase
MENGISIGSVDAKSFATEAAKAANIGATYIGGCCGTNPSYIKALKEELENRL